MWFWIIAAVVVWYSAMYFVVKYWLYAELIEHPDNPSEDDVAAAFTVWLFSPAGFVVVPGFIVGYVLLAGIKWLSKFMFGKKK